MTDWPLYEVFVRGKRGLNHVHVGSIHAADDEMALRNARAGIGSGARSSRNSPSITSPIHKATATIGCEKA